MAAVAYTSAKAAEDYYESQEDKEKYEIKNYPAKEIKEVRDIYYSKGFRGRLLDNIVKNITANKKAWVKVMMSEELGLSSEFISPLKSAAVVGIAAILGSFIPLLPFFFLPIKAAITGSLIISAIALFVTGAVEAEVTVGNWIKKGMQLAAIGMGAALIGFLVGKLFRFTA